MRKSSALTRVFVVGAISFSTGLMINLSADEAKKTDAAQAPVVSLKANADVDTKIEAPKINPLDAMPEVLAEFDGVKITKKEILDIIGEQAKAQGVDISQLPPELLANNVFGAVNGQVSMLVFSKEAAKAGFKVGKEAAVALFNREIEEMAQRNPQQLEMIKGAILEKEKMTLEQYIDKMSADPRMQQTAAITAWFDSKITVTDQEITEFYEKNKERFKTPSDPADTVRVSHIMVALPEDEKDEKAMAAAFEKAQELIAKIQKDGTAFEKLAETESACPSGKVTKGSLGPQTKGQSIYGKDFEEIAFALEVGKINDKPIKSLRGYHIIRRDEPAVETQKTLAEVKGFIKNGLIQQKRAELSKAEMDKAKAAGTLKFFIEPPKNQPMMSM